MNAAKLGRIPLDRLLYMYRPYTINSFFIAAMLYKSLSLSIVYYIGVTYKKAQPFFICNYYFFLTWKYIYRGSKAVLNCASSSDGFILYTYSKIYTPCDLSLMYNSCPGLNASRYAFLIFKEIQAEKIIINSLKSLFSERYGQRFY